MKKQILYGMLSIFLILGASTLFAADPVVSLDKAPLDRSDLASLQRGAKFYMNYCSGCHSLKFMRYDSLAEGIGIVDEAGQLLSDLVKENLVFTTDKLTDPITTALPNDLAEKWFGVVPPDLSLVSRSRGVDWIYTYLRSFYPDETKLWGVNNLVYPGVAMPHVLEGVPEEEYDEMVADLVNFLSYVGEPVRQERLQLGGWVLLFLSGFLWFAYLLYREYWKEL